MLRCLPPAFWLFVLSSVLAELVSGTLPAPTYFHPLTLVITLVPYGAGVLICRELTVRFQKGWVSLLCFGMAFGVLFEGIVTRVFVNPGHVSPEIAAYSFWHGWNLPNTIGVTHFHAVVAIVSPVFLVEMLFPDQRGKSWISTRVLGACCLVLPAWAFVLGAFVPYVPDVSVIASVFLVTAALVALGLAFPKSLRSGARGRVASPWVFALVCAAGMTLMMVGTVMASGATPPPPFWTLVAVLVGVMLVEFALLFAMSAGEEFGDKHRLAMVSGFLAFFIFIVVCEDVKIGMITSRSVVCAASVVFLFFVRLRIRSRLPVTQVVNA